MQTRLKRTLVNETRQDNTVYILSITLYLSTIRQNKSKLQKQCSKLLISTARAPCQDWIYILASMGHHHLIVCLGFCVLSLLLLLLFCVRVCVLFCFVFLCVFVCLFVLFVCWLLFFFGGGGGGLGLNPALGTLIQMIEMT